MKIKIDTKQDSVEDIRKAIKVLQFLAGDLELSATAPSASSNVFGNIFSEQPQHQQSYNPEPIKQQEEVKQDSTSDLFADLFSEEEIAKMKKAQEEETEEEELPKDKKPEIEFY